MTKKSAGILLYRFVDGNFEVLLVHPGGPYWAKKDLGAWSIPKGEFEDEDPIDAAKREFSEEIGISIAGDLLSLTPQKQKGGKIVYAWAIEGDLDTSKVRSNTFEMEWPPKSGRKQQFPEIDKAEWFPSQVAYRKMHKGQNELVKELAEKLNIDVNWEADESSNSEGDSNPSQLELF